MATLVNSNTKKSSKHQVGGGSKIGAKTWRLEQRLKKNKRYFLDGITMTTIYSSCKLESCLWLPSTIHRQYNNNIKDDKQTKSKQTNKQKTNKPCWVSQSCGIFLLQDFYSEN